MSKHLQSPAQAFTAQLTPRSDTPFTINSEDSLLPLFQHWLLALIVCNDRGHKLFAEYKLRKFLKVGNPECWNFRNDETAIYDDDTESSYEANTRRRNRRTAELLAQATQQTATVSVHYSHPLFANLGAMQGLLGLNDTELAVLCVLVVLKGDQTFNTCVSNLNIQVANASALANLIVHMTRCHSTDVQSVFRPDSALRRMGLLTLDKEQRSMEDYFELADGLASLLMQAHASPEPLIRHFLTPRAGGSIDSTHFPHLADEISVIAGVLGAAMRQGVAGTNVLLYGAPGVGKTEFAVAIAKLLNAEIFEVGYADSQGDPIRGVKRLQSYNLCQRLLGRRRNALVLFDEVEDMLEQGETPGKAWVNRALEENPIPAIWITNNVDALDPAYRRRFDYSLHVKTPPRSVRLRIAQHHLGGIAEGGDADGVDQQWLKALAQSPDLTPGQMERAAKVARLVDADSLASGETQPAQARVLKVLERSAKLLAQSKLRHGREMATTYDLAYLNTNVPIASLVDSLARSPGGSMCFYGPPGAGKTALARHIAQELELPVILRRGSDLLSMYVGGTEKNIAEMFEAAAAEPSVLILDEADSFLQSRTEARHSWELTQVNELLTQMEEHTGLFICTTNLLEKLDAASLRRFDWKISFAAMNAAQRWAFFLQEFHLLGGNMETARSLQPQVRQQLGGLTPGEFAPVTRQFRLLGRTPSAAEFFECLRAECITKGGAVRDLAAHHHAYSITQTPIDQPVAA